ncbi:MAG: DUF1553 domain-containing protein [Planctomycetota bacterium]
MQRRWIGGLLIVPLLMIGGTDSTAREIDFEADIAPILAEHCVRCHSPNNRKGDLSLATMEDVVDGGYIVPGDADGSSLIDLISGVDGEPPEMPQDAEALSTNQVTLIRRWVDEGATWPEAIVVREASKSDTTWWSLQPLSQNIDTSGENVIDRLVDEKLGEQGLRRNPPADRVTLIRRATFDLTGLPPTPDEVDRFLDDTDPDAYEKLIDRLLRSPRYGERWGRHWLDVVRFGESNGFERNVLIENLWPFRDYVIESLNVDKPFDQFIREHLAGDILNDSDPDTAVASAFLVAGPYDNVGNQDAAQAAQIRANTLDEMIRATGQAFLGMTIGCARCHDHKFDPISQQDYYSLYATFAAVRHGAVPLATSEARAKRASQLKPLNEQERELQASQAKLRMDVLSRVKARANELSRRWPRDPVDRTGTDDSFEPVIAKFVRLVCEARDTDVKRSAGFTIDEFEIWSSGSDPRNVALADNGAVASGPSRKIEDFPGAYGPHIAIDGKTGERFISAADHLIIELAEPTEIDRIVFSSARGEAKPDQRKFAFVAEYRVEVSLDGENWRKVIDGSDRKPVGWKDDDVATSPPNLAMTPAIEHRLMQLETNDDDRAAQREVAKQLAAVRKQLREVPSFRSVWIGTRAEAEANGPFHVFLGGSPQKQGDVVAIKSLSSLESVAPGYHLDDQSKEADRRRALAQWITDDRNARTLRVLANRLWHYHFGTGIVDTPSDFGYMGGRPTHPELLDYLALKLRDNGWRIKPVHRLIMLSQTYRQSSTFRGEAARIDGDARMLWRFPPRRLSAEEIRDSILDIAGKLPQQDPGGPGFRLYHYLQDNVSTYVPRDNHGAETYRRAIYHQNARASVIDLMTDFDQPDCAFTAPKRAQTTTPLQALTMLNHRFTIDMADSIASRLEAEVGGDVREQLRRLFRLGYSREPSDAELREGESFIAEHQLSAYCRVFLNTAELIYVK